MAATRVRKQDLGANVFAVNTVALGTAAAAGTSGQAMATDDTILAFDATAPSTQAFGDSAAVGSASVAARRDHKHAMPASPAVPTGATPGLTLGTSNAAGSAATFVKTDATILAFDVTNPTAETSGAAAAVGTASTAARRDHVHAMPTIPAAAAGGTPAVSLGTAAAAGSSGTFLRDDDTIVAFDATNPSTQAFGDSAAVGSATVAARRDHKHAMMAAPATVNMIVGELATTVWNGVLTDYILAHTPTALSYAVYKNGLRQQAGAGNDYTLTTATITFLAGNLPIAGDVVLVDYRY
jgi:hypothetical protein